MDQFASIVLLIDPDARHRATAALLLKSRGFSVVAVRNAQEALETFEAHHADIALIIADHDVVCPEPACEPASVAVMAAGVHGGHAARVVEMQPAPPMNIASSLLTEIQRIDPRVPIIAMAELVMSARLRERYRWLPVSAVIGKPLESDDLDGVLARTSARTVAPAIDTRMEGIEPLEQIQQIEQVERIERKPQVDRDQQAGQRGRTARVDRVELPAFIDLSTTTAPHAILRTPAFADAPAIAETAPTSATPALASTSTATSVGPAALVGPPPFAVNVSVDDNPTAAGARTRALVLVAGAGAGMRTLRRRVPLLQSRRLLTAAAATMVGLTLTTWLEIRGGASPQPPPIQARPLPLRGTTALRPLDYSRSFRSHGMNGLHGQGGAFTATAANRARERARDGSRSRPVSDRIVREGRPRPRGV